MSNSFTQGRKGIRERLKAIWSESREEISLQTVMTWCFRHFRNQLHFHRLADSVLKNKQEWGNDSNWNLRQQSCLDCSTINVSMFLYLMDSFWRPVWGKYDNQLWNGMIDLHKKKKRKISFIGQRKYLNIAELILEGLLKNDKGETVNK